MQLLFAVAFLQGDEGDAGEVGDGCKGAKGERAVVVFAEDGVALPGDADFEAGDGGEGGAPIFNAGRVGGEVRDGGGDGVERGVKEAGEAEEGKLDVDDGRRCTCGEEAVNGEAGEEGMERARATEVDLGTAGLEQRQVAGELDGVAEALLLMDEDRAAGEGAAAIGAVDDGGASDGGRRLQAPFVFGPATGEIAGEEPEPGAIEMDAGAIGFEAEGLFIEFGSAGQVASVAIDGGKVGVGIGMVGIGGDGGCEALQGRRTVAAGVVPGAEEVVVVS